MSKIAQTSVSCGFFNSFVTDGGEPDRLYNAEDMSSIFDGLINDGVFASIGDKLIVTANSGNTVQVGTGKCWFNHTWTLNDAPLLIECEDAPTNMTRIDAIVVEINANDEVRDNFIKFKIGTPSSYNPTKPALEKGERLNEYALCYITRKPGAKEIIQSDIENAVGTAETPFVTGIVQVTSLDELLGQWTDQLNRYVAAGKDDIDNFIKKETIDYNDWYDDMRQLMSEAAAELGDWTTAEKNTIMTWFDNMKDQLSEDAAVHLQSQINADVVERILMEGLPDGTKTLSDDGTVIKSVDSKGRVLTKTFTNNFLTITSELKDRDDKEYLVDTQAYGTDTINGIEFRFRLNSTTRWVIADGTATSDTYFMITELPSSVLEPDVYSLSGCPIGGTAGAYYLGADLYNGDTIVSNSTVKDVGYGAMLDLTDKTYTKVKVFIAVKPGVEMKHVEFNPSLKTTGTVLGTMVKEISANGKTIETTLLNNAEAIPNLAEIEKAVDAIIANEDSYIGEGTV